MGILYILTLILLGISFMLCKKTDEKINFIKWLIIFFVFIFGYNIFIGMILGLLNITSHIVLLSIINLIVAGLFGYKSIKNKDFQKYFVRKLDIVFLSLVIVFFVVMFVKDLYIYNGDVTHFAVDSAVHYRAAKHYADNLKIFINVEDKTFFDFNVMQPGAYINDGIFMNVINGITKIDHTYIYQMFETMVLFLSGLAFYASFIDKVKTKRGLIGSLALFGLYMYAYPYNSWIFGFSYLSVGIMFVAMLIPVVEELYNSSNKKVIVSCITMLSVGLIFSYCLFVPAIFAAICIYCFLKDFTQEGKTYLKIFKKTTLIVTGILLLVTVAGIGYLFIPTFFIEGQTDLISALKIDGAIYKDKYTNLIAYIPFAIVYAVDVFKRIKEKKLTYMDVFSIIMMGFFALIYLGNMTGRVSEYYMVKVLFIVWLMVLSVVVDVINRHIDEKFVRIDFIVLFAIYILVLFKNLHLEEISKIQPLKLLYWYLLLFLIFFATLPEVIKKINLEKIKFIPNKFKNIEIKNICISGCTYVILWALFVAGWAWVKAGHVIGEEEKHSLPNLIGMYYTENCDHRKLLDLEQNFNKNEIELAIYARENIPDLNADNIELLTISYYARIWATAVLEINSDNMPYQNFIQDTNIYTVEDALKDESKKYIVQLVSKHQSRLDDYNNSLVDIKANEKIEILFENENGFVAKINR